jgi:protein-disulfide isomerase
MKESKEWNAWVEAAAQMQGIKLAPGRAEKIAAALSTVVGANDPMRDALQFEADPTSYLVAVDRCRAR